MSYALAFYVFDGSDRNCSLQNALKPCNFILHKIYHSYVNTLFEFQPGDQITLDVVRGNETIQVRVTLGEAQPD
jgi:hypothetical protein